MSKPVDLRWSCDDVDPIADIKAEIARLRSMPVLAVDAYVTLPLHACSVCGARTLGNVCSFCREVTP